MRLDDMIREDESIDILTNSLHYFYWKRKETTNETMTFDISIYNRLLRTLIWRTRRHLMNLVPFCLLVNAFCLTAQIATDECIYLIFNKRYFGPWQLGRSGHLGIWTLCSGLLESRTPNNSFPVHNSEYTKQPSFNQLYQCNRFYNCLRYQPV